MRQAAAIFLDAYRELNARKLFWITLVISGLVDSVLLMIGITDDAHLKFMWWRLPFPIPPRLDLTMLLKATFITVGINLWLTWAATILALISTASIFPDFITSGSIDLVLAKPIGRLRLFTLKYISGLLFVALQVGAFAGLAFLIIGARTGTWEAGLLLAIPLVLVFFSYLFCMCVLLGVLTRSTVASLLLTLLFWLLLFAMNSTDKILLMPRVMNQLYVEKLQAKLDNEKAKGDSADAARITALDGQLRDAKADGATVQQWHNLVLAVKSTLPKTDDTMKLLEGWLIQAAHLSEQETPDDQPIPFLTPKMYAAGVRAGEVVQRLEQAQRERTVGWVIGTSLGFECVTLAIAAFIFRRRDF